MQNLFRQLIAFRRRPGLRKLDDSDNIGEASGGEQFAHQPRPSVGRMESERNIAGEVDQEQVADPLESSSFAAVLSQSEPAIGPAGREAKSGGEGAARTEPERQKVERDGE